MPALPQQRSLSRSSTSVRPGMRREQRARLAAHALAVGQMTGVVIGTVSGSGPSGSVGVGQHLGDVADPAGQGRAAAASGSQWPYSAWPSRSPPRW